jgi:hypothetical protein
MTHLYVAATLTGAALNNNCYAEATNMFEHNTIVYSMVESLHSATGIESDGFGGATVSSHVRQQGIYPAIRVCLSRFGFNKSRSRDGFFRTTLLFSAFKRGV